MGAPAAGPLPGHPRRVAVVACGAKKLPVATPAGELYVGPLFWSASTAAERLGGEVWILSAAHGLVHPTWVLDPYDVRLGDSGSVTAATLTA